MKDVTFYVEYDTPKHKQQNKNNGNCLAVYRNERCYSNGDLYFTSAGAIQNCVPNCCHITFTGVSSRYLSENCKRVSEGVAREIHPALFKVLESL